MESAIPAHLQTERTVPTPRPDGFVPPVPAFVGRLSPETTGVSVAYIGLRGASAISSTEVLALLGGEHGPLRVETGVDVDADEMPHLILAGYWNSPDGFRAWFDSAAVAAWWARCDALPDGVWLEAYMPHIDRFETLQSHQGEGVGILALSEKISEPILEHNYWGGSRDRIPAGQTDLMEHTGTLVAHRISDSRVRVEGHGNIAVIRSGQDWSATEGEERDLYLNTVEPTLRSGMTYLRDEGLPIGCYECRYVRGNNTAGKPEETSYGYAVFRDLADLEAWAKSHDTHQKIFGTFLQVAGQLGGNIQLKLYHEVAVIDADASYFEYVNCPSNTGLLAAI